MVVQIDAFPFMFGLVFFLIFIFIIFSVIISFYRLLRKPTQTQSEEPTAIVREREIIKEIVKIRCPYCNNLYDENYNKCPHCGGKRKS